MWRSLCLAGMTLLLFQATADLGVAQEPEVDKGKVLARSYDFKEAEKKMDYSLYVPTSYDKEKPSPLIVALHGLGSSARAIIRYPGFTSHAEKHGYLVVAPTGYNSRGWYGSRGKGGGRGDEARGGEQKRLCQAVWKGWLIRRFSFICRIFCLNYTIN